MIAREERKIKRSRPSNVQIFLMTFFFTWSTIQLRHQKHWRNFPLRKLSDAIDRFCALHPRLAIPGLMRYIVGANIVTYFLDLLSQGSLSFLAMSPAAVLHREVWRIVTYVLLPTSGGIWLLLSCLFYYWLGETLERIWGSAKFTVYYL